MSSRIWVAQAPEPAPTNSTNTAEKGGHPGGRTPSALGVPAVDAAKPEAPSTLTVECQQSPMLPSCALPEFTLLARGDLETRLRAICVALAIHATSRANGKLTPVKVLWKSDPLDLNSSYDAIFGPLSFIENARSFKDYQQGGFFAPFRRRGLLLACPADIPWSQPVAFTAYVSPTRINFAESAFESQACTLQRSYRKCFRILKPSEAVSSLVEAEPDLVRLRHTVAVYAQAPDDGEPCSGCQPLFQEKMKEGPMTASGMLRQQLMEACLARRMVLAVLRRPSLDFSFGSRLPSAFRTVTHFLDPDRRPLVLSVSQQRIQRCRVWGPQGRFEQLDPTGECLVLGAAELFALSHASGLVSISLSSASALLIEEQGKQKRTSMLDDVLHGASLASGPGGDSNIAAAPTNRDITQESTPPGSPVQNSLDFSFFKPVCPSAETPPLTEQPFASVMVVLPASNFTLCASPLTGFDQFALWLSRQESGEGNSTKQLKNGSSRAQANMRDRASLNASQPDGNNFLFGLPVLGRDFTEAEASKVLTRRSMFKAVTVRDPFLRVLAAYEKMAPKGNVDSRWLGAYFGELKGVEGPLNNLLRQRGYLPFKNFVSMVHSAFSQNSTTVHLDLRPQSDTCGLHHIRYDVVAEYESQQGETMQALTAHFGKQGIPALPAPDGKDPESGQPLKLLYDRDAYARVLKMYRKDIFVPLNHIHMHVEDLFDNALELDQR